jgi:putative intracellular protease/amidase
MPRKIAVVIFPDFQILDATGPIAAFEIAGRIVPGTYELTVLAAGGGEVASSSGAAMLARPLDAAAYDTIVVSGGNGTRALPELGEPIGWLCRRACDVRRIASVCSGAYLLAEAGLLDGKRATTHWSRSDDFARRYPKIRMEPDRIFVRQGDVWTSAGITAGIDLALALIEDDLGAEVVLDQGERQVDAGGDAGRGPDRAVADEDAVGLQAHARMAAGDVDGVAPERGDAAARVDDHGQPALVGQGEHRLDALVGQPEALGARVHLDADRARGERALGFGKRVVRRIDAQERHEPPARLGGLADDAVVRPRVAVGVGQREDRRARAGQLERLDQPRRGQREAVGILPARVRVDVERLDPRDELADRLVPRVDEMVGVHVVGVI